MNYLDLPPQLDVFDGYFHVIEGDVAVEGGFGRIWVRPVGNSLPQQFLVKLGAAQLRLVAIDQITGSKFHTFAVSDKGWVASVLPLANGDVKLVLYGIGQVHKSKELDFYFTTTIEGEDPDQFDQNCRLVDTWSARDLLLLRIDSESNAMFLVGEEQIGQVRITDGRPEIVALLPYGHWGDSGRWILLDGEPLGAEVDHWDELSLMFLQSMNNSMSDFMAAWKQYNDSEEREVEELRARVGVLQYGNLAKIIEGTTHTLMKLTINRGGGVDEGLAFLKDRLEFRGTVIVEISEQKPSDSRESRGSQTRNPRVEVDHIDMATRSIQIRVPKNETTIPNGGFLFVSIAGDLTQINRRRTAEAKFATGDCQLKGLSEILRESPQIESRRRRHEVGVSSKLRSQFEGELTPRQIQAIDIAINTPDVALIQGPPGTGKTQVIALIEQRLAELEKNGRTDSLILLTSTQNDAVDQVAAKTRIFGLPPDRDKGRGDVDPIEVWQNERREAAYSLLDSDIEHNRLKNIGNLVEKIVNDHFYLDEQLDVLAELMTYAIDDETRTMLNSARTDLEHNQLKRSHRDRIERRIRSLRTTQRSYEDDGYARIIDIRREIDSPSIPKEWRTTFLARIEKILENGGEAWVASADLQTEMLDMFFNTIDDRPRRFSPEIRKLSRLIKQNAEKSAHPKKTGALLSISESLDLYVNEIANSGEVDEIVRQYTVVHAATCQRSAKYLEPSRGVTSSLGFENIIVDEAARVSPTDLLIPLVQAKQRVILVGDHRQLPITFDENIARGVSESDLLRTSLFERLFVLLQDVGRTTGIPRTVTLNTQYRMHSRLGSFVSQHFYEPYGEKLESGLPDDKFEHQIKGWENRTSVWVDVPLERGQAQRAVSRSWYRDAEATEVANIASRIVRENPDVTVGVITFYSAQKERIIDYLDEDLIEYDELGSRRVAQAYALSYDEKGKGHERLRIGSVDAFQGKEFDVVILSIVRSQPVRSSDKAIDLFGFAAVENRMCVALSRQKKLLIVVGDKSMAASQNAQTIAGMNALVELCDQEDEVFRAKGSK